MTTIKTRGIVFVLAALLCGMFAAPAPADEMDDLKKRFKERYEEIYKLKKKQVIGETYQGYVEVVGSADDDTKKLIAAENNDRKKLYEIIAKQENTTAEKVAEQNARRQFSKAEAGMMLKGTDGKWVEKS